MTIARRYHVTRTGRVISELQSSSGPLFRDLKQSLDGSGYLMVCLMENGQRHSYNIHRLVARHYLPPRPTPQHELRHIDGNKYNNRADNLAWSTHAENMLDARRDGRIKTAAQLRAAKQHIHSMELFEHTLETAQCQHRLNQLAKQTLHAKLERWRHDAHASTPPNNTGNTPETGSDNSTLPHDEHCSSSNPAPS